MPGSNDLSSDDAPTVDLNADLGESFGAWVLGDDEALLEVVTSANVACGFHAGDPATLVRTCQAAVERGVTVGAQVSYRDLAGFGRRFMDVAPDDLYADVLYQVGALDGIARTVGGRVAYVKPHGALYNAVVHHQAQADAVVRAVADFGAPCRCSGCLARCCCALLSEPGCTPCQRLSPTAPTPQKARWSLAASQGPCCTTRMRWPSGWCGWSSKAGSPPWTAPRSTSPRSRCACMATRRGRWRWRTRYGALWPPLGSRLRPFAR